MILEKDLNSSLLYDKIKEILADEKILEAMSKNSYKLAKENSSQIIVDEILKIL